MEVKASFVRSLRANRALVRLAMGRRFVISLLLHLFLLGYIIVSVFSAHTHSTAAALYITFSAFLLISLIFLIARYVRMPGQLYNRQGEMKDCTTYYLFTDEQIQFYTKTPNSETRIKMQYGILIRVQETSEYLFLYRNTGDYLGIDKSSLLPGDLTLLRNRLRTAGIYDCKLRNS